MSEEKVGVSSMIQALVNEILIKSYIYLYQKKFVMIKLD